MHIIICIGVVYMLRIKRYPILIFVFFMLVSVAAIQAQQYRPATGIVSESNAIKDGLGEMTIINDNSRMDALAVITNQNKEPLIKVFIRAGESYKITGIRDGWYDLYFKLGSNWNQGLSGFDENEQRYKLDRSLQFETVLDSIGISYSAWTVALEEAVPDANEAMAKVPVTEEDFPV